MMQQRNDEISSVKLPPEYKIVSLIASGAYGTVYKGFYKPTSKTVAIKVIKDLSDKLVAKRTFREIELLHMLRGHPNMVSLEHIIMPLASEENFNELILIFDYMQHDLKELIATERNLTIEWIQHIIFQILRGLYFIHSANVVHRDLKPANILIDPSGSLKICDFGMGRMIMNDAMRKVVQQCLEKEKEPEKSTKEFKTESVSQPCLWRRRLTQYVTTRCYRAPEIITCSPYGQMADLWSVGCIFAELLKKQLDSSSSCKLLFPGNFCYPLSSNSFHDPGDQLLSIIDILGTPTKKDFSFMDRESKEHFEVSGVLERILKKKQKPWGFSKLFPAAPLSAIALLKGLLAFHPAERLTVAQALAHPFLKDIYDKHKDSCLTFPLSSKRSETDKLSLIRYCQFEMELGKRELSLKEIQHLIMEEAQGYTKEAKKIDFSASFTSMPISSSTATSTLQGTVSTSQFGVFYSNPSTQSDSAPVQTTSKSMGQDSGM